MFSNLSNNLGKIFQNINKKTFIDQKDLEDGIKAIEIALIESDVNYEVIKKLISNIKQEISADDFNKKVGAGEIFVNLVSKKMIAILGESNQELAISKNHLYKAMIVGNQGSGKTTTIAKLANHLKTKKLRKKPLIIAADIYRFAAVEQIQNLGKKHNIDVFFKEKASIKEIVESGMQYAKENNHDAILIDTAGRLHIDEKLMGELKTIETILKPQDIIFVADAMVGQEIVNVASGFLQALKLSGVILTKVDGDSRGGGALSIVAKTKVPIMFIGTGEKINKIEKFYPKRIVDRILGLGDIVSLVEQASEVIDENTAQKIQKKMMSGKLNFNDFLTQLKVVKKMGTSTIFKLIPGLSNVTQQQKEQMEKEIIITETLINSMTKYERKNPKLLKQNSRKSRIINGSGLSSVEFNKLMRKFEQMQNMSKLLKQNPFNLKRRF